MMLSSAQQWIALRSQRERLLLSVACGLAMIWIGYALIWQPLRNQEAALLDQIARHESAIAILQTTPVTQAITTTADTRPVPVIVTDTAANFSLTIRRLEPEGSGARVVLDEVAFDNVILWLERLQQNHGLRVSSIDMDRRPTPGIVTATLTLQR